MVRLVLADSHIEVRRQLAERLARESGLEIVCQSDSAEQMLTDVARHHPDLLLVDPDPHQDAYLGALKHLRADYPDLRIVVLASVGDTYLQVELRRLGISRIFIKGIETSRLLPVLRQASDGQAN